MLARWIATVAALLLACAHASAHVRSERAADLGTFAAGTEHALEIERSAVNASPGELARNPKTAPPARASLENPASGENALLTHCHAWENWSPLRKCASGVHKYLYANGNPGSYVDPSGNCAEPVTAVICALGLATVATAAVEYARLSWFGNDDEKANAGQYAVQNATGAALTTGAVIGAGALLVETGGAATPFLVNAFRGAQATRSIQGAYTGIQAAYVANAPRALAAAEGVALAGAGATGTDLPSITPRLPLAPSRASVLTESASELDARLLVYEPKILTAEAEALVRQETVALRSFGERARTGAHRDLDAAISDRYFEPKLPDADGRLRYLDGRFAEDGASRAASAVERSQMPPNRNRRDTQDETIFYRIVVDGDGRKVGITSIPPDGAGVYERPEYQARKLRELYGPSVDVRYQVRRVFDNRSEALDYERAFLERFKRIYGEYPGETLPGGNRTNH